MPVNELYKDVIFSTIELENGQTVKAVLACGDSWAAVRIAPKAFPYVKRAQSVIIPNKNGQNTVMIHSLFPDFLAGTDIQWVSTKGTTYMKQTIEPSGELTETITSTKKARRNKPHKAI